MCNTIQTLGILGSTGNIGISTINIVKNSPNIKVNLICAKGSKADALLHQCLHFEPKYVFVESEETIKFLSQELSHKKEVSILHVSELQNIVPNIKLDICIAAIDGFAGLIPTFLMTKCTKRLLIANKEAIVCGWRFIKKSAEENSCSIVPIDSEHNSVYQLIQNKDKSLIKNITITASGGPFFRHKKDFRDIKNNQVLKHPKWKMGTKNTVNSANLINKGLEVIEACHLFDISPEKVNTLIHPQAIIHAIVTWKDNSSTALLSNPNMSLHISNGIFQNKYKRDVVPEIDLVSIKKLEFFEVDQNKFPSLQLAREAFSLGEANVVEFNAINEACLDLFLSGQIKFYEIVPMISANLSREALSAVGNLEETIALHRKKHLEILSKYER